jgi:hypothetical protein
MQRCGRKEDADAIEPWCYRRGQRGISPAPQHQYRTFCRHQNGRFFRPYQCQGSGLLQSPNHHCERLGLALFAGPETDDRWLTGSVYCEVKSTEPAERENSAPPQ